MALAVWADAPDVPTFVCADARLRGSGGGLPYPGGTTSGQGGWDMGFHFANLSDLADKLCRRPIATPAHVCGNWIRDCPPIRRGQVTRLAINAHGLAGQLYVGSRGTIPLTADNAESSFHSDLHDIGLSTSESATILLMGCVAGQGPDGTRLLQALQRVWPGRTIVAFATVGYAPGGMMKRPGEPCTEPGMRDTGVFSGSLSPELEARTHGTRWGDLTSMPWASEASPGAKVIRGARIVRGERL
jgi:hypothetical protein